MASRPATRTFLLLLTGVVAAACGRKASGPRIDSVTPGNARNTSPVTLQISGANFFRSIVPDASSPGDSHIESVRVLLTGPFPSVAGVTTSFELVLSSAQTPTSLTASVAAGHALGSYDLTVIADGGRATKETALVLAGPPVALTISSATEATPGTSNLVTLTASLVDANGLPSSPDPSAFGCSPVVVGGAAGAPTVSPALEIATGQNAGTIDVSDKIAEAIQVGCTNSVGIAVTAGTATFIPGPAQVARVLDATGAVQTSIPMSVVIEDVDGNAVATHTTDYHIGFSVGTQLSGGGCSPPTPSAIQVASGASAGSFSLAPAGCQAAQFEITPSIAEGLIPSSGVATWQ